MINAKKLELINELKALREEKGMSYQQIADKTVENNEPVSLSTIKLVFSKNNKHDHDYLNVLKPIADALSFPDENDSLDKKTLQTRLELKDEIIEQLKIRLETKEAKHKDREEFYMNQIVFLQEQVRFKDEQIKHHSEAIDRKDAVLKELYSIIIGMKKSEEVFK